MEHAGIAPENRFNSENEARKTLATMLGAIVVLGGAYFTWRNIKLVQEGQITDRFTKAIEQIGAVNADGKKKMEVRLGGIYALERIANQSERDHWPIVEVLTAYVRENTPRKSQGSTQENQASAEPPHQAPDIRAILTVLGRRDHKHENQRIDLAEADIHGARLGRAALTGAYLSGADLTGADLHEADLSGAELWHSDLRGAHLRGANLSGAELWTANLSGADLREANLRGALLDRANLSGADLSAADLRSTQGLTQEQVDAAKGDTTTQLPKNLHKPESWGK